MNETTPASNAPQPPPRFRWGRVVLACSLALNLGVLGMVIGAAANGAWRGGNPSLVRDIGFGAFSQALNDDGRKALRRAFVENAPDMRKTRTAMREDMTALLAALRAEPFDATEMREALQRSTSRARERQELGEKLILDFVAALPTRDRLDFADRLESGLMRQRGGGEDRPSPRERHREP